MCNRAETVGFVLGICFFNADFYTMAEFQCHTFFFFKTLFI